MSDVGNEARKIAEARTKVNVALWSDQQVQQPLWCPICRVKYIFQDNGTNVFCRSCGVTIPTVEVKHEKKLTSKFPSGTNNPMIISQKRKKSDHEDWYASINDSVNSHLDEEDKQDLRSTGINI